MASAWYFFESALGSALDEMRALLLHFFSDLLAHGAAQEIRLPRVEAGKDLRGLHHLL